MAQVRALYAMHLIPSLRTAVPVPSFQRRFVPCQKPSPKSLVPQQLLLATVPAMAERSRSRTVPEKAARAAKITGLYIGLIGVALFIAPVRCFSILFDPHELRSIWIRVFGTLCALLGWYYYKASYDGAPDT